MRRRLWYQIAMRTRLLFISFLVILTGCTKSPEPKRTTITLWTSDVNIRRALTPAAEKFAAAYGVDVEISVLNKNLTQQFRTASLAQRGPDIFFWAHDVVGELAQSGLVAPVDYSAETAADMLPVAREAFAYNGAVYGYPFSLGAVALIYNPKLINKPPASLNDLIRVKTSAPHALLFEMRNFYFSFPFFSAFGTEIFSGGKAALDSPAAVAAASWLRRFRAERSVPAATDRGIAFNEFIKGNTAMIVDGPWALRDLKASKIDFAVAPIPGMDGQPARPLVGVHGFMLRRSGANQILAKELIERFFLSPDALADLVRLDPRLPATRSGLQRALNVEPALESFSTSVSHGVPMPNIPAMASIWPAMDGALHEIVNNDSRGRDIQQILREAVKKCASPNH
jgi:maltose/maltodextrin transport system substrate-binding protein